MPYSLLRSPLSVALIFTLTACSGVKSPRVELQDVTLGEVTDEGFVLNFGFALTNPNVQPLELSRMKYDVSINGTRVYAGVRSAEATLASNTTQRLIAPAVVLFSKIGSDAVPEDVTYAFSGRVSYIEPGRLAAALFDIGLKRPSVGFRRKGEIAIGQ
ncbi:MAG: LEA type 2 family protein [Phycisphaerales bacterium]